MTDILNPSFLHHFFTANYYVSHWDSPHLLALTYNKLIFSNISRKCCQLCSYILFELVYTWVSSHFKIYRFAIFSTKNSELIHVNKIRWKKNQTEFNNSIMPKCFHLFAQSSLILQGRNNVHWIWNLQKSKLATSTYYQKKNFQGQ